MRIAYPAIVVISVIAGLIALALYIPSEPDEVSNDIYKHERHLRLGVTLQNKTNSLIKDAGFWLYAPVLKTSVQESMSINSTNDYDVRHDDHGNQILYFKIPTLPPFASKVMNLSFLLRVSDAPEVINDTNINAYLKNESYIETSNQQLIALANTLKGETELETARNAFNWVSRNIKYAGYIKDNRGALYAYNTRRGDCTEYMFLYTALMRINGIPTRNVGGYVYAEDSVLKAEDFHNWSEVYLDGAWQVVDPQGGSFLDKQGNYIAFRIITDEAGGNIVPRNTQRFAVSDDNITIQIN